MSPGKHPEGSALARRWARMAGGARTLRRGIAFIVRMLVRAAPRLAAGLLLLTAVQSALPVLNVRLTQLIINNLAGGRGASSLFVPLLIYLALMLASAGLTPALNALEALVSERLTGHVNLLVLARVNAFADLSHFEDPALYDDLSTIGGRAPHLPRRLLQSATRAVEVSLAALGLCLLMASLHPLIPLALLVVTMPALLVQREDATRNWKLQLETAGLERGQEYWMEVGTGAGCAREVQLFGIAGWVRDQFARCLEELDRRRWRVRSRLLRRMVATLAVRFVGTTTVFLYLVARGASGRLLPGDFVLFLGSLLLLDGYLRSLPLCLGRLIEESYLAGRFLAFLDPEAAGADDLAELPAGALCRGVTVEHLSFGYPGRAELVLKDISFKIPAGETVALVGKNGAGKTTLVKLLTGLYRPAAGRILLDGRDLAGYDIASVRARVAVAFQDYGRYLLTAGENIGLGHVEALGDRERIERAARDGGAEPLIQRLEQGYDTRLGKEFGGTQLSGGEWQKLALSRAFMRDADLLILDEPTAALDVRAEAEMYQRFHALLGGRSGLLISHRFSTVRMADRILVLDEGRIVEDGTHDALLAQEGLYAGMFRMQAEAFQTVEEVEA